MKSIFKKTLLLGSLLSFGVCTLYAQKTDTTKKDLDRGINVSVKFPKKDDHDSLKKKPQNGFFILTFANFDLGLSKLVDNGSLTLSPNNDFLDYKPWKTNHVSFDVLKLGYRFTDHFRMSLNGGFDWTLIRLDRDYTMLKNQPTLSYFPDTVQFSKNRFSSSYVHIPLNFEFRSGKNSYGKRFKFSLAPEVSFLLNGKTKQISDERGKVKVYDDFHFSPVRYGITTRIGYGGAGLFFKYYANDMFDTPLQKGLKNMAFGITIGL
jgi:hypothetical protein